MGSHQHAAAARAADAPCLATVLALAIVLAPGAAFAQPRSDQDKAVATTLFEEGRALLTAGKVAEACRKLEESRRLDPLPGTILNLAACHEREGLTASAMAEFREARALAERDHRSDRVAFADAHIKALEPHLSTLVIALAPGADAPELAVTFDGVALGRAAWGTRIPVDPGTHVIVESAPGKQARRVELRVGPDGDAQTATLAPLDDVPAAPPPPPPAPLVEPPLPPATVPGPALPGPETAPPSAGLSARRTWALAAGSAGVVGIGLGSYLGLTAISKHDDPAGKCAPGTCTGTQNQLNKDAGFDADAATVSFAVGLAALGVGAFLWLGDSSSVRVSAGLGSAVVTGRF